MLKMTDALSKVWRGLQVHFDNIYVMTRWKVFLNIFFEIHILSPKLLLFHNFIFLIYVSPVY